MFKAFIRKYFKNFTYFYQYLRHRIFVVILLTFLFGAMDGLGLSMFLPLFQIAANKESGAGTEAVEDNFLTNFFTSVGIEFSLLNMLILMVAFFSFKGLFYYIKSIYDAKVSRYFIVSTRKNLLEKFSRLSFRYFIKSDVGAIQNLMTNEINNLLYAFRDYLIIIQKGVMVIVYMIFAFAMNAEFAILIILGGLLFNFIFQWLYKITMSTSRKLVKESNNYQGTIIQLVSNFKYLKATGFVRDYAQRVTGNIESIESVNYRLAKIGSVTGAIREPILIFVVASVILLQVYVRDSALSTIIVSLLFFYRALTNVTDLQAQYNYFLGKVGTMENVASFSKDLDANREVNGKLNYEKLHSSLSFQNVTFAYGDHHIIKGINLDIAKNQTVALVGESGSGKSTMVNILAGLLNTNGGKYYINGESLESLDKYSFQKRVGYISQDTVIFNASIYNNVTLWAEKTPENLKRFEDAIHRAHLATFVGALPDKSDTLLGNNGINLSGGQKQRVSIARELFKEVDILILDEATSALDSETEKIIQENIDALKGQFTIIIIAHRLATVRNADKVVLMSDGQIIGSGDFEELKNSSLKFKKMVQLQEL